MKKILSPLFCTALFFAACDDELTNISGNSAETVTAISDLHECNKDIVGKLVYVSDSVKVFTCMDDGWAAVTGDVKNGTNGSNGADGKDGASGKDGTNGKNGKDGANGKDGTNGKDGKNGNDGASCTVKAIDDGYKVLCGGDSVGVLLNGTDGAAGKSCSIKQAKDGIEMSCPGAAPVTIKNGTFGDAGKSCSIKQAKDGIEVSCPGADPVTIKNGTAGEAGKSCTAKQVDGGIEVSCPDSDPVIIKNGTAGTEGKSAFEVSDFEGSLAEWFDSMKGENGKNGTNCNIESDENGIVTLKCGDGENATTTTLYKAVCGEEPYEPQTHFCLNGKLYLLCGKKNYNIHNQFCFNDAVYDFCAGDDYDPTVQFCRDSKLYDLCGGQTYNPYTQVCENGKVREVSKCAGTTYYLDNQFCAIFADGTKQINYKVTITIEEKNYSATWMANNLKYATAEGSYCYEDKEKNCDSYGRLYTWAAAVGESESRCGRGHTCNLGDGFIQGVCPNGWHLPSKSEFEALYNAVEDAANSLRSSWGWDTDPRYDGFNGTNAYSFAAYPAGKRVGQESGEKYYGQYFNLHTEAKFWTSTAKSDDYAHSLTLGYRGSSSPSTGVYSDDKSAAVSVRCVKNKPGK